MNRRILEFNGNYFELIIAQYLREKYKDSVVIHNKSLYSNFLEKDTQLDVILVNPKGIVVLEAKCWKQWIRGDYRDFMWHGKASGKDTMQIISPVNQNFLHIRALRNAIRREGFEPPRFGSLVCVPDGTTIKSDCKELCNYSMLQFKIDMLFRDSDLNLDVSEFAALIQNIK